MTSPARKHFQRVTAATVSSAAAAASRPLADANAYELMLVKLDADRRRLKQIQSIERKIAVKREILPEYEAWVQGVLESGSGVQDDVLMSILVWRIDVGDAEGAIDIAAYALTHKLSLPDQYHRTLACLLADEFADYVLKPGAGRDIECMTAAVLQTIATLTDGEDMPDEVRAKLMKAIGIRLEDEDPEQAVEYLKKALSLHDKVGVKKDIERIERKIKNSATADSVS